MEAYKTKRMRDLREKIVCLLISNPLHKPSVQCAKSGLNPAVYYRPLDDSTIGIAEHLIKYIETAECESNDFESFRSK